MPKQEFFLDEQVGEQRIPFLLVRYSRKWTRVHSPRSQSAIIFGSERIHGHKDSEALFVLARADVAHISAGSHSSRGLILPSSLIAAWTSATRSCRPRMNARPLMFTKASASADKAMKPRYT